MAATPLMRRRARRPCSEFLIGWRLVVALGVIIAQVSGCSLDPNVRKQEYFETGQRYFAKGQYREASIPVNN
jgi:hypothetical protein